MDKKIKYWTKSQENMPKAPVVTVEGVPGPYDPNCILDDDQFSPFSEGERTAGNTIQHELTYKNL